MEFNSATVRWYMRKHAHEYRDHKTGEVNATLLAEATAIEFGQDYEGGPLDDPNHWIWDLAIKEY